ncbi:hypothetical protein PT285_11000 [Lactobacillus sp. ESL0791]|uniref:hypothetical protein n=1 Tax=Lactobacillus sp. ESL0791 TaxID=2983234 RepID=UPI0023F80D8A|nr:hypothetical protein [Lactobacillus sp. ESL0791]MDF7639928.1 hypothetical protein [Lactobacillus sp. ESL0791]
MAIYYNGRSHNHFYYGGKKWTQDPESVIGKKMFIPAGTRKVLDYGNGYDGEFDTNQTLTILGIYIMSDYYGGQYSGSIKLYQYLDMNINQGEPHWVNQTDVTILGG